MELILSGNVLKNNRIPAIKVIRQISGSSLGSAKDIVDSLSLHPGDFNARIYVLDEVANNMEVLEHLRSKLEGLGINSEATSVLINIRHKIKECMRMALNGDEDDALVALSEVLGKLK